MSLVAAKLSRVAIIATACTLGYSVFNGSLFSYHPTFMVLGYILLMSEGVIQAIGFRGLDGEERVKAIQKHMWVQAGGVFCATAGFLAIFANKIRMGKPHFVSNHAKVGLLTIVLSTLAPLGGMASFKSLGLFEKLPMWMQARIKRVHRYVGTVAWFASLVAIELGLPHQAVFKEFWTLFWQGGVAFIGLCILHAMTRKMPKTKGEEDSCLPK